LWRLALFTGAIGLEMAACIVIGYFGGSWLDGKFHSTPWLKWIGFGAGLGACVKALIRVTRSYKRMIKEDEK
jgi:F0F1-type ATP synthase assembly protein I